MNANKTILKSNLKKIDARVISAEEYDEIPELTEADLNRAQFKVGGIPVSPAEGRAAFSVAMKKQKINITLDPDVLAWFKQQAGGRGYQTLINATLRDAMHKKTIEETLRRVIREELRAA